MHSIFLITYLFGGDVLAADPPLSKYLVRGKVQSVSEKESVGTVKVEVIGVYSGPAKLVGESFEDTYHAWGADIRGEAICRKVEVGEEGLWVLWRAKDTLRVGRPPEGSGWPFYRHTLKGDPGHLECEGVAEAIRKVAQEKPEKRLALLQQFARDEKRFTTYWAMCAIGQLDSADARKYLDELATKPDPTLPLAAQVALDEVLCRRADGDWSDSQPRTALLRAWVSDKPKDKGSNGVLSRLYKAHQQQQLADKLAVELHRTAGENKDWSVEMRGHVIRQMKFTFEFSAGDEARLAVVGWVYEQMRSNETLELRRVAAMTLRDLPPLPSVQLKAIEEHLVIEKDEKVAEALRAAIKKAKANDK
jgi:hypothetical protein